MPRKYLMGLLGLTLILVSGCSGMKGNDGNVTTYKIPVGEPEWIRNGEPLEYDGVLWYPMDSVDVLLDSEVILLGQCRDVDFFAQTVDVKPYNRLYTKFGRNKFRVYLQRSGDDQSQKVE